MQFVVRVKFVHVVDVIVGDVTRFDRIRKELLNEVVDPRVQGFHLRF